jgi:hypothetical protein
MNLSDWKANRAAVLRVLAENERIGGLKAHEVATLAGLTEDAADRALHSLCVGILSDVEQGRSPGGEPAWSLSYSGKRSLKGNS